MPRPKKRFSVSATYEFTDRAPESTRVSCTAPSYGKAALLGIQGLRRDYPRRQPSSIVVVLEIEGTEEVNRGA